MSGTRDPRPVSLLKAVLLLIFQPRAYVKLAYRYDHTLPAERRRPQRASATRFVRAALIYGLALVVASALAATWVGRVLACNIAPAKPWLVAALQVCSGAILLGATLSFLINELKTHSGKTLTERVNAAVFRVGYCVGTALLVLSLVWGLEC